MCLFSKPQLLSILESLVMETSDESLRMKIAEIAGEIAGGVVDSSEWPGIQQLTGDLCNVSAWFICNKDSIISMLLFSFNRILHGRRTN